MFFIWVDAPVSLIQKSDFFSVSFIDPTMISKSSSIVPNLEIVLTKLANLLFCLKIKVLQIQTLYFLSWLYPCDSISDTAKKYSSESWFPLLFSLGFGSFQIHFFFAFTSLQSSGLHIFLSKGLHNWVPYCLSIHFFTQQGFLPLLFILTITKQLPIILTQFTTIFSKALLCFLISVIVS